MKILNTTVANKGNARVYFEVLDQYGDVMTNYTSNKLVISAYNTTKGHAIACSLTKKDYFELNCLTESIASSGAYLNAINDKISVVAYLKDNASVATTADLQIVRIYDESLTFGEVKLGDDKRVTVNRTYEIPYTLKDSEGKESAFDEQSACGGPETTVALANTNYNFITSNISAIDMGQIYVDANGKLMFVANGTAGTAVITAINTITGETTAITIVVNNTSKLSSVDIADASVACNASVGSKVKAAVTAYDQFGEVIDAKNVKNVNLLSGYGSYFNSITATPNGSVRLNKITSDGKYVEYEVVSSLTGLKGQSITFNFISKEMGETGYIKSSSIITVDDEIEASALDITKEPDATVTEGGKVSVEFAVKDQYQNKMAMICSPAGFVFSGDYSVWSEDTNNVISNVAVSDLGEDVYKMEFTAAQISDLSKSGSFTLKLTDDNRVIASKMFNLVIVDSITKYEVSTDKAKYKAGEKINVTVDAYSADGFNANYNGSVIVNVNAANSKTYAKTIEFKNGIANFELTAGTAGEDYVVTVVNTNATTVRGRSGEYDVVGNSAGKLTVDKNNGKFRITDAEGNNTTATAETAYATLKVTDENLKADITGDVTFTGWTLNSDKTVAVTIDGNNVITTIDGVPYDLANGISVTGVPATSYNHNLILSVTIKGFTWEKKIVESAGDGTATFIDTASADAATVEATDVQNMASVMGVSLSAITVSASAIGDTVAEVTTAAALQVIDNDICAAAAEEDGFAGYEIVSVSIPDAALGYNGSANVSVTATVTIKKEGGRDLTSNNTFDVTVTIADDLD